MKIKILALLLAIVSALTFYSCGRKSAVEPKDVIASFSDSLKAFDFDGMQKHISSSGENLKTAFNSQNKLMGTIDDFFAKSSKNTTYDITKTEINDDVATITVNFTFSDYNIMYREIIAAMLMQSFSIDEDKLTDEKLKELFIEAFPLFKDELPDTVTTSAIVFTCAKEIRNNADTWVIKEYSGDIFNIMSQTFTTTIKSIGNPLI